MVGLVVRGLRSLGLKGASVWQFKNHARGGTGEFS